MIKILRNTSSTSGLGRPKWRNDHLWNMWLCCCAVRYHFTASNQRFRKKHVLQRCVKQLSSCIVKWDITISSADVIKICELKQNLWHFKYICRQSYPRISFVICTTLQRKWRTSKVLWWRSASWGNLLENTRIILVVVLPSATYIPSAKAYHTGGPVMSRSKYRSAGRLSETS